MVQQRARNKALRNGRFSEPGRIYSVTTCCKQREPVFLDRALGEILVDEIIASDRAGRTDTCAFVVMPDHLHWLFQLRQGQCLSSVVSWVKGKSSFLISVRRGQAGPVWQPGFHDHGVRKSESLRTLADYIIHNPVRAGLVGEIDDYPLWDLKWQRFGGRFRG